MLMVFLFDSANIALVGYRLRFRGTDGSANHFDTKSLSSTLLKSRIPAFNHYGSHWLWSVSFLGRRLSG